MEFLPFPARLRAGDICETGLGRVAADDAVDFTGDFVPLLPLGHAASLEWIMGDGVVYTFRGTVYLSSPSLLRVVGVDSAAAAEMRRLFACNVRLAADFAYQESPARRISAQILYLTESFTALSSPAAPPPGSGLLLNCEVNFLTLRDAQLKVLRATTLRKNQTLLHCTLFAAGDENLIALSAYVSRLERLKE